MRLDVAVHDPAAVGEARREQHLDRDVDRRLGVERAVFAHEPLERAARQVLHRDVVGAVPGAAVEDRHDVRMREPGGAGGLAPEALDEFLVFDEAVLEHLDGDLPR